MQLTLEKIVAVIQESAEVDAIYLYGSRSKGTAGVDSDWDFAVLFSEFLKDPYERAVRPYLLQQVVEKKFSVYDKISIVDLEDVSIYLKYNIIRGEKCYDSGVLHVRRIENAILSEVEKDYDNFQA